VAEQEVGTVTHYFGGPGVAIVKLTDGELAVGDKIKIVGHTSNFEETVTSMQLDHKPVERGTAGQEVAIKVTARARKNDKIVRVT
jgi:U32 family peptidase